MLVTTQPEANATIIILDKKTLAPIKSQYSGNPFPGSLSQEFVQATFESL